MDIIEAMNKRHSVRRYSDKPIEREKVEILQKAVDEINAETGMNIQLLTDEPNAFTGTMASYGHFEGVKNYFAMVCESGRNEEVGYQGEKLVILAQQLGLNTCWVALTYNKRKTPVKCNKGEKLQIVISLGYGETQGREHKNKPMESLYECANDAPCWFMEGMKAAMTAPTAMNQQKFKFIYKGNNKVKAKALPGPYAKMDLGIVKYHFELGAGKERFTWTD